MRRKTKRLIASTILVLFTLGLIIGFIAVILPPNTEKVEEPAFEPVDLVITTPEQSTHGVLNVKLEDTNEVVYQYNGDNINIINTGRRGEDVLVEIYLSEDNLCDCLKEGR